MSDRFQTRSEKKSKGKPKPINGKWGHGSNRRDRLTRRAILERDGGEDE